MLHLQFVQLSLQFLAISSLLRELPLESPNFECLEVVVRLEIVEDEVRNGFKMAGIRIVLLTKELDGEVSCDACDQVVNSSKNCSIRPTSGQQTHQSSDDGH